MSQNTDLPPVPPGIPPAGPAPLRPHVLDQLWAAMRRTGIRRPTDDRWLGGVCSGTARRLGVDPVLLRVALGATLLLGGIGVVLYAVALVLLPDHDGRIELERASHGDLTGTAVGAVALLLLAIVVPSPWALLAGGDLVSGRELVAAVVVGTTLLVGLAVLPQVREALERSSARTTARPGTVEAGEGGWTPSGSAWTGSGASWERSWTTGAYGTGPTGAYGSGPSGAYGSYAGYDAATGRPSGATAYGRPAYGPPPVPRPPRPVRAGRRGPGPAVSAAATGAALAAAGAAWLAALLDLLPGRPAVLAACAALLVLGAVLVGLGIAGRRDGGVGFSTFLVLVAVAALLLVPSWRTTQLAGERTFVPSDVTEAGRGGTVGLGDGVLDLTDLADLPAGAEVDVPVRVGIGELTVLVPEGMDVRVDAVALVGSTVRGAEGDPTDELGGLGVERRLVTARDPQVVVDARVFVGTVRVVEVEAP